jgi:DNA-binding NtrC family response regulator
MKKRVLVVHDDDAVREFIGTMLTEAGYECRGADGALKAIAFLSKKSYEVDLILTDLSTDDLGGVRFLQRLRDRYPYIPVIVFSDTGDESTLSAVRREKPHEVLRMPFEHDHLLTVMREALEGTPS